MSSNKKTENELNDDFLNTVQNSQSSGHITEDKSESPESISERRKKLEEELNYVRALENKDKPVENPDVMENAFDARGQFISRYFNMLGGIKPLAYMEKEYFKKVLTDIKPSLLNIKSINDVQNKQITM